MGELLAKAGLPEAASHQPHYILHAGSSETLDFETLDTRQKRGEDNEYLDFPLLSGQCSGKETYPPSSMSKSRIIYIAPSLRISKT